MSQCASKVPSTTTDCALAAPSPPIIATSSQDVQNSRPESPADAGSADDIPRQRMAQFPSARSAYRSTSKLTRRMPSSGTAPNPKAKLLMLEHWRTGLRVSEALDLEARDLSLCTPNATIRIRSGNGGKSRLVPVHSAAHSRTGTSVRTESFEAHPSTYCVALGAGGAQAR